jgi:hypothetical protein
MIDTSKIKNKSIVTVVKYGQEIQCEVVDTTALTCTIVLPDGSHQDVAKHYVIAVEEPKTNSSPQSREI